MSLAEQSSSRPFRAIMACGALLCMTLLFHLPSQQDMNVESLRGKRKNFTKEIITESNLTAASVRQHLQNNNTLINDTTTKIDMSFLVAGFAKCGTSTLLKTFEAHNETAVAPEEECSLDDIKDNAVARATVLQSLRDASTLANVKRGIKCPFSFTRNNSLQRLEQWFPNTKLIYGLRHPVYWFESYFNYRVLAFHAGKIKGPVPSAETLLHSNEWERVSTDAARFETVLQQLVSTEKQSLKFPVFLYTLEQMKGTDENEALRNSLGSFLGLQYPIQPLKKINVNNRVGDNGYKETIDICDSRYDQLRTVLVKNGQTTQQWIREKLLPHATVANRDGFVNLLKQWGQDPCTTKQ